MPLETTLHVYPVGDLIEHDTSGALCVCGPSTEYVIGRTGNTGTLIMHHSLDGRELAEAEQPRR